MSTVISLRKAFSLAGILFMSVMPVSAFANNGGCVKPSNEEVASLFDRWNDSLQTLDPVKVAANYNKGAVLLPTVSDQMRTDEAGIQDYFAHFLELKPSGKIVDRIIHADCDTAIDTGHYLFSVTNKEGKKEEITARYTFVYGKTGDQWLIESHHSSVAPR